MDAMVAIQNRRSIKQFASNPVSRETLEKLLAAAYDAPSGASNYPCRFVAVTERDRLDRLGEAHPHCGWLKTAQAAIVVAADSAKSRYWLEDCCVAAQNLWVAATAMGLGMAWSAIYLSDNPEETAKREGHVRQAVALPDALRAPIVLGLGTPDYQVSERTKRPPMADVMHWGKY